MKWDSFLTLCTKINSKWITNLDVIPETIKLLEENVGGKLLDVGLGNDFLHLTLKAKATGFPGGAVIKNPPANAGDTGSSPALGRCHMPWSN